MCISHIIGPLNKDSGKGQSSPSPLKICPSYTAAARKRLWAIAGVLLLNQIKYEDVYRSRTMYMERFNYHAVNATIVRRYNYM
jgi:hypothetical protein